MSIHPFFTKDRESTAHLVHRLCTEKAPAVIVAVGGDGTVNDVLNGLTNFEQVTFAYIPSGSGNDLARGLHLETDPLKALEQILAGEKNFKNLMITVLSFGFKYGIPSDCDLVFDVRFLPNPYYVEGLKYKTGNDKEVQDFVMGYELSHTFLDKLVDMLEFLIPNYILEGKNQLVIGIGCTGGKHRSVTLANKLFEALSNCPEYGVRLEHRDVSR